MININSFSQSLNDLTRQVNIALGSLNAMNESLLTENDSVTYSVEITDPITGDPSLATYSMPSYQHTLQKLQTISNTMDVFVSGEGVVLMNDGSTFRRVSTVPLAKSPEAIEGISSPTSFKVKDNWFFESLIFPQMYVQFDLKGKIDDRTDRVKVRRIIFDNFDTSETEWFKTNFSNNQNTYTYSEAISLLDENEKRYWTDEETQDLPINPSKYTGSFTIQDVRTIENKFWYYLDTLNYGLTTDGEVVNNIELNIGDRVRFNETLFRIDSIVKNEKRIRVVSEIGTSNPKINSTIYIYSVPFEEKLVDIPIGYNECNVIFIKCINDDFNILADSWGDSISFYTNDLLISGGSTTLESYYYNYIIDFGKQMEGQAKEKFIPAYFGVVPTAPAITADQFSVSQINQQVNSALDTDEIKNTQTQIESTKTIITSLKSTISQQKAELVELTNAGEREDLQEKINSNISQLSKKTVEYQSLVKSLATLAYENDSILSNPKYRIRGFFEIPTGSKQTNNPNEPIQEIIQFEIAYRYLRLDNTGNPLNTYSYVDPSSGQKVSGTFTDWQTYLSPIKSRTYDSTLEKYVWSTENIADGEQININQVDIPITKGEKVEIKIRSISEAGWPINPLKSNWSNTVIISFPANLQGSDQVENILSDAALEQAQIQLDETLNATGIITHLEDGFPNPNTGDGTYFKHQAKFLSYDLGTKDINGEISSETTTDLQSVIDNISTKIYVTLSNPTGIGSTPITGTLQKFFQAIVNTDPSVYEEFRDLISS